MKESYAHLGRISAFNSHQQSVEDTEKFDCVSFLLFVTVTLVTGDSFDNPGNGNRVDIDNMLALKSAVN